MARPSLFWRAAGLFAVRWTALLMLSVWISLGQSCGAEEKPTLVVRSVKPPYSAQTRGLVSYGLTRDDLHWLSHLPGVRKVIPRRHLKLFATVKEREIDVQLAGTIADFAAAHSVEVTRGRFITAKDEADRQNVAVISDHVAGELLPSVSPLGRHIRLGGEYFTVVGVFDSRGEAQADVFVPLATMRTTLGDRVTDVSSGRFVIEYFELSQIELWLHEGRGAERAMRVTRRILRKSHDQDDYSISLGTP